MRSLIDEWQCDSVPLARNARTSQECKYTNIPRAFARRDKFTSKRAQRMQKKKLNAKATRQISPIDKKNADLALESISYARMTCVSPSYTHAIARAVRTSFLSPAYTYMRAILHASVCL